MPDPIADRVRLSEYRINYGAALWRLPAKACPLVIVAMGLICGVLAQSYLGFDRAVLAAGAVIAGAFLVAAIWRKWAFGPVLAIALAAIVLVGMCRVWMADNRANNHINTIVKSDQALAAVEGVVVTEPIYADYANWVFASPRDRALSFYLRMKAVKTQQGFEPAKGVIRVQISNVYSQQTAESITRLGDSIRLYCKLIKPQPAAERWQFDFHRYLYNNMIELCAYASHPAVIQLQSKPKSSGLRKFHHWFTGKTAALLAPELMAHEAQGLLGAMVLGRRENISPKLRDAFGTTGLMHLLSLSGMHIAIFCGSVWLVMRLLGIRQRLAAAGVVGAIFLFMYLVPIRAASLRASIIALTFAFSIIFSRKSSPINTLAFAAIIILLINPRELFNAGWQLSFGCVLSILLLTSPIQSYIHRLTKYRFLPRFSENKYDLRNFAAAVILSVSASVAASIGSAGILAYHFGAVYPYSALWTVLLSVPFALVINFSLLTIIVSAAIPTAAPVMQSAAQALAQWFIVCVELIANAPFSDILTGMLPLQLVVLFYAAFAVVGYGWFVMCRNIRAAGYCLAAGFIVLLCVWSFESFNKNNLRLTILPVGHGQAIFAELPGGENILYDCGSSTFKDCGSRILSAFLRARKVRSIDNLVISHKDSDHINGLDYVFKEYNPQNIYAASGFLQDRKNPLFAKCEYVARDRFCPVQETKRIYDSDDGFVCLFPPIDTYISANDNSLVVFISVFGFNILLPADIEKPRQKEITDSGTTADILLMPHHGSTITTDPGFAEAVGAKVVIPNTPQATMQPKTIVIEKSGRFELTEYK